LQLVDGDTQAGRLTAGIAPTTQQERNDVLLSPSVIRRVALFGRHLAGGMARETALEELTDRERQIVAWVATGRSNDQITKELVLSPDTMRTHVSHAMVKLGARPRPARVFAVRAGLILPPGEP
jgi:DNA-binding NarL/FixJ family response regulator